MISFVSGVLENTLSNSVIIDNNGVGYRIFVPKHVIESHEVGQPIKINTYLHVAENIMALYGFGNTEELSLFELLISVSGIGPKGAIGILSSTNSRDFVRAIITEDTKEITKAPGIGLKTAQRLILELKDKLKNIKTEALVDGVGGVSSDKDDAMDALLALGYQLKDITKVMSALPSEVDNTEDMIKMALRSLSGV